MKPQHKKPHKHSSPPPICAIMMGMKLRLWLSLICIVFLLVAGTSVSAQAVDCSSDLEKRKKLTPEQLAICLCKDRHTQTHPEILTTQCTGVVVFKHRTEGGIIQDEAHITDKDEDNQSLTFLYKWWEEVDGPHEYKDKLQLKSKKVVEDDTEIVVPHWYSGEKEIGNFRESFYCPLDQSGVAIYGQAPNKARRECANKLHKLKLACQCEMEEWDVLLNQSSQKGNYTKRLNELMRDLGHELFYYAKDNKISSVTTFSNRGPHIKYVLEKVTTYEIVPDSSFSDVFKDGHPLNPYTESQGELTQKQVSDAIDVIKKNLDPQKTKDDELLELYQDELKRYRRPEDEIANLKKDLADQINQWESSLGTDASTNAAKPDPDFVNSLRDKDNPLTIDFSTFSNMYSLIDDLSFADTTQINRDGRQDYREKISFLESRIAAIKVDIKTTGSSQFPVTRVLRTKPGSTESNLRLLEHEKNQTVCLGKNKEIQDLKRKIETTRTSTDPRITIEDKTKSILSLQKELETIQNFVKQNCDNNLFDKVIKLATQTVGTLGVIILIIGAYFMITARGDDSQLAKGKDIVLYTAVGLVIIFLSFTIVQFVVDLLLL